MTASTNRRSSWKKAIVLLLLLISAVVSYDVYKHDGFKASNTDKLLKRSGLSAYGHQSWVLMQGYSSRALEFIEASSPEYYKATVDTCKPYMKLAGDVYIVMKNVSLKVYDNIAEYTRKNGPRVTQTIEHYVPGMLDEIKLRSNQSLEFVKVYANLLVEKMSEHSAATLRWLEHNVFVGKLSPESLQNYATKAIDTTQSLASQTYDWVYEKVQTLSKVP